MTLPRSLTKPDGLPKRKSTARGITAEHRRRFLDALAEGSTVRDAAKLAGRDFSRWYELRRTDAAFAEEWEQAFEAGTQAIEAEAHRRAIEGFEEVVTDGEGKVLRITRRYSDALLQTLLKGRRPSVYGNQPAQVGVSVQVSELRHAHGLTLRDVVENSRALVGPSDVPLPQRLELRSARLELPAGEIVEEGDA